jgi:hypothetical protein
MMPLAEGCSVDEMLMGKPDRRHSQTNPKQKAPQNGALLARLTRLERVTFGFVGMLAA